MKKRNEPLCFVHLKKKEKESTTLFSKNGPLCFKWSTTWKKRWWTTFVWSEKQVKKKMSHFKKEKWSITFFQGEKWLKKTKNQPLFCSPEKEMKEKKILDFGNWDFAEIFPKTSKNLLFSSKKRHIVTFGLNIENHLAQLSKSVSQRAKMCLFWIMNLYNFEVQSKYVIVSQIFFRFPMHKKRKDQIETGEKRKNFFNFLYIEKRKKKPKKKTKKKDMSEPICSLGSRQGCRHSLTDFEF